MKTRLLALAAIVCVCSVHAQEAKREVWIWVGANGVTNISDRPSIKSEMPLQALLALNWGEFYATGRSSLVPLAKPLVIPPAVQLVVPAHHAVASRDDGNELTYAWAI